MSRNNSASSGRDIMTIMANKFQVRFLANSIDQLSAMGKSGNSQIDQYISELHKVRGHILLNQDAVTVSLGDEFEFAASYISLYNVANNTSVKLRTKINFEERQEHHLLPMTMHTILEILLGNLGKRLNEVSISISIAKDSLFISAPFIISLMTYEHETLIDQLYRRYQYSLQEKIRFMPLSEGGETVLIIIPLMHMREHSKNQMLN